MNIERLFGESEANALCYVKSECIERMLRRYAMQVWNILAENSSSTHFWTCALCLRSVHPTRHFGFTANAFVHKAIIIFPLQSRDSHPSFARQEFRQQKMNNNRVAAEAAAAAQTVNTFMHLETSFQFLKPNQFIHLGAYYIHTHRHPPATTTSMKYCVFWNATTMPKLQVCVCACSFLCRYVSIHSSNDFARSHFVVVVASQPFSTRNFPRLLLIDNGIDANPQHKQNKIASKKSERRRERKWRECIGKAWGKRYCEEREKIYPSRIVAFCMLTDAFRSRLSLLMYVRYLVRICAMLAVTYSVACVGWLSAQHTVRPHFHGTLCDSMEIMDAKRLKRRRSRRAESIHQPNALWVNGSKEIYRWQGQIAAQICVEWRFLSLYFASTENRSYAEALRRHT